MKKIYLLISASLLFLLACKSSSQLSEIVQGNNDSVANENSKSGELSSNTSDQLLNLSNIDFEPDLLQPGDLPPGITYDSTNNSLPPSYSRIPNADNLVRIFFKKHQEPAGSLIFLGYNKQSDADLAFDLMLQTIGIDKANTDIPKDHYRLLTSIGDDRFILKFRSSYVGTVAEEVHMIFIRCHAITYITITDYSNFLGTAEYAANVDQRIKDKVCP